MSQFYGFSSSAPFGDFPPLFLALAVVLGLLVLVPAWLLLARSSFLAGDSNMTSSANRIPQLYGYSVCLVALLAALFSITSIVDNIFRLREPLRSDERWAPFEVSLDSFESYKATYQRNEQMFSRTGEPVRQDTLSAEALRRRYDALRAERIANVRFQAQRALTGSTITLLISIGLFVLHWRWLKRRVEVPDSLPAHPA